MAHSLIPDSTYIVVSFPAHEYWLCILRINLIPISALILMKDRYFIKVTNDLTLIEKVLGAHLMVYFRNASPHTHKHTCSHTHTHTHILSLISYHDENGDVSGSSYKEDEVAPYSDKTPSPETKAEE